MNIRNKNEIENGNDEYILMNISWNRRDREKVMIWFDRGECVLHFGGSPLEDDVCIKGKQASP